MLEDLVDEAFGWLVAVSISVAFCARGFGEKIFLTMVGEPLRPHWATSSTPASSALHFVIVARAAASASAREPRRISLVASSIVIRHGSWLRRTCTPPSARRSTTMVLASVSSEASRAT
jgi:hypothetical protein